MSRADTDVRVALIGYGLGGAAFHAPLIACTPGMRLATIVTGNPERRAQAVREHPRANVVDSVQAIWDRASDHDNGVAPHTVPNCDSEQISSTRVSVVSPQRSS